MTTKSGSLQDTKIGKYTLERLLGRGAYGEVYVGSTRGGEPVAVKVLDATLARDAEVVERFQREAEMAKRLVHPGIVRVFDVGAARGRHYIVMELVHGGSLRRLFREGGAPAKVLAILADVARALAYAHGEGVVHRDVKPENILLTKSRRAKVADFGLARAADQTTMTTDGAMIGTASYMSPEQARGARATAASDVYAMGLIIYEAISGKAPFSSETPYGFLYQHVEQAPPRPRVLPSYPPALASLALRCLAKDPGDRPAMSEVAARLEEASLVRPPRFARVSLIVAGALAVLFLVVVAHPPLADPLCGDWFGGPAFSAVRDAAQTVHDAVLGR